MAHALRRECRSDWSALNRRLFPKWHDVRIYPSCLVLFGDLSIKGYSIAKRLSWRASFCSAIRPHLLILQEHPAIISGRKCELCLVVSIRLWLTQSLDLASIVSNMGVRLWSKQRARKPNINSGYSSFNLVRWAPSHLRSDLQIWITLGVAISYSDDNKPTLLIAVSFLHFVWLV